MKKTTVYLEENELKQLKKKAFLSNKSTAELIRMGIRLVTQPSSSKEAKALKALEEIRSQFEDLSESQVENLVDSAKKVIRRGKKSRR
ncbi:MAG: hypothetical protein HYW85_06480 [Deltaproteobacteria bacterium]|nr:hypothetical protein [Deltaproteobacteria bacterium]MBI3016582.1 hypothetical protein [Deltaproteobacteria bacterium]